MENIYENKTIIENQVTEDINKFTCLQYQISYLKNRDTQSKWHNNKTFHSIGFRHNNLKLYKKMAKYVL
jgi:hypothetical protein